MNDVVAETRAEYVVPLYCFGDSHTEALNGLLLRDAQTGAPLAVGASMYAMPTAANAMSSPEGAIAGSMVPLLYAIRLLRFARGVQGIPTFAYEQHTLGVHSHAEKRWVMLFAGEYDARNVIAQVPLDATIDWPEFDYSQFPPFHVQRVVSLQSLENAIVERLRPLIALVMVLRSIGITRVALTSIPPPTLDDATSRRLMGIESHAAIRYAVHRLLNRHLANLCSAEGIAFVDTWSQETDRDLVRPGLLLDGVHLGREAAIMKLQAYYDLVRRDGSAEVAFVPSIS